MAAPLTDMHCHLGFTPDPAAAARALQQAGTRCACASVTPGEYDQLVGALAGMENVRIGAGLHPWWVLADGSHEPDLARVVQLVRDTPLVAEIGLDAARAHVGSLPQQMSALDAICEVVEQADAEQASRHVLSVHTVHAVSEALDILEAHDCCRRDIVVLHWFAGSSEQLVRAVEAGCMFSCGGRMLETRRGRDYARQIPLDRLLLETDLPNSPADGFDPLDITSTLRDALDVIARMRSCDTMELELAIADNAARVWEVLD